MNTLAHPHFETPRQRHRRAAREEVNRLLDQYDRMRRRVAESRVLVPVQ